MTIAKMSQLEGPAREGADTLDEPAAEFEYAGTTAQVEYHGERFPAFHHMYNCTWLNERAAVKACLAPQLGHVMWFWMMAAAVSSTAMRAAPGTAPPARAA